MGRRKKMPAAGSGRRNRKVGGLRECYQMTQYAAMHSGSYPHQTLLSHHELKRQNLILSVWRCTHSITAPQFSFVTYVALLLSSLPPPPHPPAHYCKQQHFIPIHCFPY